MHLNIKFMISLESALNCLQSRTKKKIMEKIYNNFNKNLVSNDREFNYLSNGT